MSSLERSRYEEASRENEPTVIIMKALYIFLDESGNLDFSRNRGATLHYVLAAVSVLVPLNSSQKLQQLKYSMLCDGEDVEFFHASEDKQATRDKVIEQLKTMGNDIKVNYIYANKAKTHPKYQSSAAFYALLGKTLLHYIVSYKSNGFDKIVIVFDKALTNKDQKAFLGEVKPALKKIGKPYSIFFHRTLSDFNGQIADYFAWSKYISLERGELRPLDSLSDIEMKELDIFRRGEKEWY